MKRKTNFLSLLISITLLISSIGGVFAESSLTGTGTAEDPYIISDADGLNAFCAKVNSGEVDISVKLISDIDLGGAAWSTGTNKYKGNFNGNNHEISNWKVSGDAWIGFFNRIDGAVISNLKLKGEVSGTVTNIGGFVGMWSGNGKISNCISDIKVTSPNGAAGFVGWSAGAASGAVENCIFTGECSGAVPKAFTGDPNIAVTNSYYLNDSVKNTVGVAVTDTNGISKTQTEFESGEVTYALGDAFGQLIGTDNMPVFLKDDKSNKVYLDNGVYTNTKPSSNPDENKGSGTAEDPYIIGSAKDLHDFAVKVNGGETDACARVSDNIDLSAFGNWTPIGTDTNRYRGTFSGGGYDINNLTITGGSQIGLFGAVENALITDVKIAGGSITGDGGVGSVAGWAYGTSRFERCANYADLKGGSRVGGICGYADNGTNSEVVFESCYSVGNIDAVNEVSGICLRGKMYNCFVMGKINATQLWIINAGCDKNNNYYLEDCYEVKSHIDTNCGSTGGAKRENMFKNGEVAYLLGENFGQVLGKDEHPVIRTADNVVVKGDGGYYNKYGTPSIDKIEFIGADGGVNENPGSVSAYTKEIRIVFNSRILPESIEGAVHLYKNGSLVAADGHLDKDMLTYTIKLDDVLNGEYKITIDKTIVNVMGNSPTNDYEKSFVIKDEERLILADAMFKSNGYEITQKSDIGDRIEIELNMINPTSTKKCFTVMLCGYVGKDMTKLEFIPITIDAAQSGEFIYTGEIDSRDFSKTDRVKLFVIGYPIQRLLINERTYK